MLWRIHKDQGPNFESRLFKELCSLTNVAKSHTTPYHAMGNGLCERFNMVHAYNCLRQDTTGYSPYYLMFGREPKLPVDLMFGIGPNDKTKSTSEYIKRLRLSLKKAYNLAPRNLSTGRDKQEQQYNKKVKRSAPGQDRSIRWKTQAVRKMGRYPICRH